MVTRSPDALLRIVPVSLTVAELAELEDLTEKGVLPKDHIDRYFDAVDANVFGEDAPKDRRGNRKEQGLGSPTNQTAQSIEAYKRWCGPGKPNADPDFAENLKRMEKELAESNARRKADADKARSSGKRRFVV